MVWRRTCIRYSCQRRGRVRRDQDGEAVVAASVVGEDFPAADSAAGAAARSSSLAYETTSKTKSKASDTNVRPTRAKNLVRPERLELPTLCSEGRCSIRLSYGRLTENILRQVAVRSTCFRLGISMVSLRLRARTPARQPALRKSKRGRSLRIRPLHLTRGESYFSPPLTLLPQRTLDPHRTLLPHSTLLPHNTLLPESVFEPQRTLLPQGSCDPQRTLLP